jgi:hypothetical protein
MKVKTNELTGIALDYAVAKAGDVEVHISDITSGTLVVDIILLWAGHYDEFGILTYEPSTDWSIAGPIIEEEGIWVQRAIPGAFYARNHTEAYYDQGIEGKTYLEAAMRCYVASKLGNEIEIPDELANEEK